MAFAQVGHTQTAGGTSGGTSPAISTVGANLIVISLTSLFGSTAVISDNQGNTYTFIVNQGTSGGSVAGLYYCLNPVTNASHTFTIAGSSIFGVAEITAWSGAAASAAVDQSNAAAAAQPGSITPSQNNCLVISNFTSTNTSATTVNGGFTITDQATFSAGVFFSGAQANLIQTTAAAANPTWTGGGATQAAAIASFKAAGSIPTNTSRFFFAA